MRRPFLLFGLLMLILPTSVLGRTWYITPDGTGDAPTIQAGVDSASAGDTVLVACGIYTDIGYVAPDGVSSCVRMKSNITLLGEGDPSCVVLDAQQQGRVILCDSITGAVIDGLTITGGLAPDGGGIFCEYSEVLLTNLMVIENAATARYYVGGGGICIWGTPVPTITDCIFERNTASNARGGAICFLSVGGEINIARCIFIGNESLSYGGAVACREGRANFWNCWFEKNTSDAGGAIAFSTFDGRRVDGCIFLNNKAHSGYPPSGAAIDQEWGYVLVTNSTFYGNDPNAIALMGDCTMGLMRTIITGSTGESVVLVYDEFLPWVWAECTDIYGNGSCDWCPGLSDYINVEGNFSECPSFCNAAAGDFYLCDGSPCLPGNRPYGADCGLIGALGEGCACGPSATEPTTWSKIKSMFR